jgi:hypothetical protein
LSTKSDQLEWRRSKVIELRATGLSHEEIAHEHLRQQAKHNIKRYIDERLPEEYEKCLVGLNAITREAWKTEQNTQDNREKIQALSLAKECYSMKMDLLTNATVVDDAMKFAQQSKDKLVSMEDQNCNKEPKEPAHDEGVQSEEKQEEETGEITTTTNQVF